MALRLVRFDNTDFILWEQVGAIVDARRGCPSAEDQPEIVGYSLTGSISADPERGEAAKRTLGKFIIATNELDTHKFSRSQILEKNTDQGVSVERVFRFLKDPLFFADSQFLRNLSALWP